MIHKNEFIHRLRKYEVERADLSIDVSPVLLTESIENNFRCTHRVEGNNLF
ncbi:hypothetical protein [Parageobacillus thermoglucosidasius]|uniref:Uncharacterized protein n=1 Tax=Parageobacillus thermoglucosidasius TaxID=1426 RepID=A0AB38QZD1_PARTM|nr:hypothetical protein [Parageobacillus thermoglucosidasius]UOE76834.1 hypothetical protein IMI45_02780 [Parageobacillus thermoglucosidasius]